MKKTTEIDFTPLSGSLQTMYLSEGELSAAAEKSKKPIGFKEGLGIVIAPVVCVWLGLWRAHFFSSALLGIIMPLLAAAIAIVWICRENERRLAKSESLSSIDPRREEDLHWLTFARANNFQCGVPMAHLQGRAIMYQNTREDRRTIRTIGVDDRTVLFENLMIRKGSDGVDLTSSDDDMPDQATDYNFLSLRVDMGQYMPHIAIYSQQNPTGEPDLKLVDPKGNVVLENQGFKNQAIGLEGKFNDYFHVYMPEAKQIDTLRILEPDVMEAMVDHGKMYNIEIVDNYLYIYDNIDIPSGGASASAVKKFWDNASYIIKEIEDQARIFRQSPENS